jgi:hypothetical protein
LFIAVAGVSAAAPWERVAPVACVRNSSAASVPDANVISSVAPVAVLVKTNVLLMEFHATEKGGDVNAA